MAAATRPNPFLTGGWEMEGMSRGLVVFGPLMPSTGHIERSKDGAQSSVPRDQRNIGRVEKAEAASPGFPGSGANAVFL
jgi:hypothetical protein